MQYNINIIVAVDVIKALSDKTLANSIYLMDDSALGSQRKGTANLITYCTAGQTIKWTCYPIDLQTPLIISGIQFLPITGEKLLSANRLPRTSTDFQANNPTLLDWTGIVPYYLVPNQPYYYRLQVEMGEGKNSLLYIDTAALMIKV